MHNIGENTNVPSLINVTYLKIATNPKCQSGQNIQIVPIVIFVELI